MRRIVVTAATGFIGYHLTDCLLAGDNAVTGVDNLSTGRFANLSDLRMVSNVGAIMNDVLWVGTDPDLSSPEIGYIAAVIRPALSPAIPAGSHFAGSRQR